MNLIVLSLWVVCFFDALILLCIPTSETVIFTTDGSAARYAVDLCALAIGLFSMYQNGWKKLPSIEMGILLIIMLISHFHAPNINFQSLFIPKDHAIFDYKPMFEVVLFFMMFMGIYSMEITKERLYKIRQALVWIVTIYGVYAIFQRFGLEQIYTLTHDQTISEMSRNPEVGGFICQPVFAAAFMAILMPFVFRYGKLWQVCLVAGGILSTGNRSAVIAVIVCALYMSQYKKIGIALLAGYISYLVLGVLIQFTSIPIPHIFGEERFTVWKQVIQDFIHPMFPGLQNSHILTGTGLGSFSVIFPFYHHSGYYQAHNEFLEGLRILGVIGFVFICRFLAKIPNSDAVCINALLAACIVALTNAIWHIPQLAFITVFIIGLLYNRKEQDVLSTTL